MNEYIDEYDDEYLERIGYTFYSGDKPDGRQSIRSILNGPPVMGYTTPFEQSENHTYQQFRRSFENVSTNNDYISPYFNVQTEYNEDDIILIQWDERTPNGTPFRYRRYRYMDNYFNSMREAEQYKRWYESREPNDIANLFEKDIDEERASILLHYVRHTLINNVMGCGSSFDETKQFINDFLDATKRIGYVSVFSMEESDITGDILVRLKRGNYEFHFQLDRYLLQNR
jgi:hypothetical protein